MDFFKPECQSGPFSEARFGLCDDQNATRAYVDTAAPEKWVATVENPSQRAVTFTAIDKCVIQDGDELGRGRCDGMLSTDNLLYLVELKDQKKDWETRAIEQLESTILFLLAVHPEVRRLRHKKAFGCNKRHKPFALIEHERKQRFFQNYGFRIHIQAVIKIDAAQ